MFEPVPFPKATVVLPVKGKQAWQKVSAQLKHCEHRNDVRPPKKYLRYVAHARPKVHGYKKPTFTPSSAA